MASKVNPVDIQGNHHKLTLKQSITLMESLKSCWSEDVLIIAHSDKFLRLSLQLISRSACSRFLLYIYVFSPFMFLKGCTSRYSTWLFHGLSARKSRNASANASQNFEWAISAQVEIFVYVSLINLLFSNFINLYPPTFAQVSITSNSFGFGFNGSTK